MTIFEKRVLKKTELNDCVVWHCRSNVMSTREPGLNESMILQIFYSTNTKKHGQHDGKNIGKTGTNC